MFCERGERSPPTPTADVVARRTVTRCTDLGDVALAVFPGLDLLELGSDARAVRGDT